MQRKAKTVMAVAMTAIFFTGPMHISAGVISGLRLSSSPTATSSQTGAVHATRGIDPTVLAALIGLAGVVVGALIAGAFARKLFHSMRYFFDNYLTYITVCLPKVKGFESPCEALSMVSEKGRQCRHYVRIIVKICRH